MSIGILLSFTNCNILHNKSFPPLSKSELKILKFMGGKVLPDGNLAIGKITIHRISNEISFPGQVSITSGDLEVLISTPTGRAYESLLVSDIDPYKLQLAFLLIGAENGMIHSQGSKKNNINKSALSLAQGTLINIFVKTENGKEIPIERWLKNKRTSNEKKQEGWVFVGSSFSADKRCLATEEGNIVNIWNFGNTILDNPSVTGDSDDFIAAYTQRLPNPKTPVTIVMKIRESVKR